MLNTGTSAANLERFANCGASCWAQESEDGQELRLVSDGCRNRWCVPCANDRARRILANLRTRLDLNRTRFVTLTTRHNLTPLSEQIARIYRCFSTLRRRAFWKNCIDGGAAFLEVKVSEKDGLWHPHLHILCTGSWIDQAELSREWYAVTGDSSIVHVRITDDQGKAAAYVTKYVTKPADASIFNQPDKLQEMIVAMRGTHLCMTFGTWRKWKLTAPAKSDVQWRNIAPLEQLISDAAAGDQAATRCIEALSRKYPSISQLPRPPTPPTVDGTPW